MVLNQQQHTTMLALEVVYIV